MQIAILLVLAVVIAGIFGTRFKDTTVQKSQKVTPAIVSKNVFPTTKSSLPTPILSSTPLPTLQPTPTTAQRSLLSMFQYPLSTYIQITDGASTYRSSDNPTTIINWYKQKIQQQGMSTQAVIQTNANGNILDKIAGASNTDKITIEISKQQDQNISEIKITISSSLTT